MKNTQEFKTEAQYQDEWIKDCLSDLEEMIITNTETLNEILERLEAIESPKPKRKKSEVRTYVANKRERDANGKFIKK